MKPELLFLSELSPGADDYRIKVKVIDISERKLSTDDCTFYETLLLCDEKTIGSIAQDIREDVRYDLSGVVLFVEEEVCLVTLFYGQKAYVREVNVVITDQTSTLYAQMLLDRQGRILEVQDPANARAPVTIRYLKDKKGAKCITR
ncbi:uncharacterized protein LOC110693825 [Chenopodium quinoa]|uniref:uncharacterized protein LOC110693825 n=1 Tax=Chenopodium quinoa TaxID=63459 RepID=UPI000B77D411|nr:uncharacterized protein LOC110693825 [Chenopodium quinoa]XP_021726671.1 uncharacterized protein LOC110693825 [Chenopodium quinoa]